MSRTGKIARLPHALREEVNRRMLDGQLAPQILPWLNDQPDAAAIWERDFEGVPASAQNLSEWKLGGHKEWRARRDRVDALKDLSSFAHNLTKSGGHIADGAASILSGQILEALEQAGNLVVTGGSDDVEKDPNAGLVAMAKAVSALQKAATSRGKLDLDREKSRRDEKRLKLDREKFERQTVTKFLEFARSAEAQDILSSGKPRAVQMDALRALMFGPVTREGAA